MSRKVIGGHTVQRASCSKLHAGDTEKPLFEVPTIREYFVDLDYVLGVISDGPAKSFAFRRLKYLNSKFTMYTLLNEYQELADMKVFDISGTFIRCSSAL